MGWVTQIVDRATVASARALAQTLLLNKPAGDARL